jgi:hypothetical protein
VAGRSEGKNFPAVRAVGLDSIEIETNKQKRQTNYG